MDYLFRAMRHEAGLRDASRYLAGVVVAGLAYGRRPTSVRLDPTGGTEVAVEHEPTLARVAREVGARPRDREEADRFARSAMRGAVTAIAGGVAVAGSGPLHDESLRRAELALRATAWEATWSTAVESATETARLLLRDPPASLVVDVVADELWHWAWLGTEDVEMVGFGELVDDLVAGTALPGSALDVWSEW